MSHHGSSLQFMVWVLVIYAALIVVFLLSGRSGWVDENIAVWIFLFLYFFTKVLTPH